MNIVTHNRNTIARNFIAAATIVAALTSGAQAADVAQIHVKYADLNLGSPAGATVLYQRIRAAARQICELPGSRELVQATKAKACIDKAIHDAVASVRSETLNGIYQSKTGNVVTARLAAN